VLLGHLEDGAQLPLEAGADIDGVDALGVDRAGEGGHVAVDDADRPQGEPLHLDRAKRLQRLLEPLGGLVRGGVAALGQHGDHQLATRAGLEVAVVRQGAGEDQRLSIGRDCLTVFRLGEDCSGHEEPREHARDGDGFWQISTHDSKDAGS
jgi:hypothetical protein